MSKPEVDHNVRVGRTGLWYCFEFTPPISDKQASAAFSKDSVNALLQRKEKLTDDGKSTYAVLTSAFGFTPTERDTECLGYVRRHVAPSINGRLAVAEIVSLDIDGEFPAEDVETAEAA